MTALAEQAITEAVARLEKKHANHTRECWLSSKAGGQRWPALMFVRNRRYRKH